MNLQTVETVTIAQAKATVAQAAQIYFLKDERGRSWVDRRRARPICLMGPAGIGKTEIVRQVAEEMDLAFLSYSITHHTRQSAIGLPRLVEGVVEGRRVTMTEYTMSEIIAQVYRTMEETGQKEGILFLDEFNCVSESLRPIMLQLLQDKSFGPHAIPDGWMLVLAGNPTEYNRAATDLDPVTADRMRMVHIRPDYAAWRAYAKHQDIHPIVLGYLDDHRDDFYQCCKEKEGTALVTARAWEDLSVMLSCLERLGQEVDLPLVAQYIQSGRVARNFYHYCVQYQSLIASGLLERVLGRESGVVTQVRKLNFAQSWNLVNALVQRLRILAREAVQRRSAAAGAEYVLSDFLKDGRASSLQRLLRQLDGAAEPIVQNFLDDCSRMAQEEDAQMQIREALLLRLSLPALDITQAAGDAVEAVSSVCRRALKGKPQLEYLVSSMMEDENIAWVIGQMDTPEFRVLSTEHYLDTEEAENELLDDLGGAALEKKGDDDFSPLPGAVSQKGEHESSGGEWENNLSDLLDELFTPCGAEKENTP